MLKAMILAAGRGERLRPLTDTQPKPLIEVAGKPLIVYHIERLAAIGVKQVVINHAWLGEQLERRLGDGSKWRIKIDYSAEPQALETGGGIKKALSLLGDAPFLVINGDVFVDHLPSIDGRPLSVDTIKEIMGHRQGYLWLVDNPSHHPLGDFAIENTRLSLRTNDKLTFSGMAIYDPRLFDGCPDGAFSLAPLLKQKIAAEMVAGEHFTDFWCDVGTPERLKTLNLRVATSNI